MPQKQVRGNSGYVEWVCRDGSVDDMEFGPEEVREADMLDIFNRYSGSHFAVSKLARRYGVCDRCIQYDFKRLSEKGLIRVERCVLDKQSNVQPIIKKFFDQNRRDTVY